MGLPEVWLEYEGEVSSYFYSVRSKRRDARWPQIGVVIPFSKATELQDAVKFACESAERAEQLRKEGKQDESDRAYQSAVEQTLSVIGEKDLEPRAKQELTKLLDIYMHVQNTPTSSPSAQGPHPPPLGFPGINSQPPSRPAPRPPPPPSPSSSRRSQVVKEIADSERTYNRHLKDLADIYMDPLERSMMTANPIVSQSDFQALFGAFAPVREHSDLLLSQLQPSQLAPIQEERAGSILKNSMLFLSAYQSYVERMTGQREVKERLEKQSPSFKAFLEQGGSRTLVVGANTTMEFYFIQPMQRVLRYKMLLQELLQCTDSEAQKEEHLAIAEALGRVTTCAGKANEGLRREEECAMLERLRSHQQLGNTLCLVQGRLKPGDGPTRWYYLFDDATLLSEAIPAQCGPGALVGYVQRPQDLQRRVVCGVAAMNAPLLEWEADGGVKEVLSVQGENAASRQTQWALAMKTAVLKVRLKKALGAGKSVKALAEELYRDEQGGVKPTCSVDAIREVLGGLGLPEHDLRLVLHQAEGGQMKKKDFLLTFQLFSDWHDRHFDPARSASSSSCSPLFIAILVGLIAVVVHVGTRGVGVA